MEKEIGKLIISRMWKSTNFSFSDFYDPRASSSLSFRIQSIKSTGNFSFTFLCQLERWKTGKWENYVYEIFIYSLSKLKQQVGSENFSNEFRSSSVHHDIQMGTRRCLMNQNKASTTKSTTMKFLIFLIV